MSERSGCWLASVIILSILCGLLFIIVIGLAIWAVGVQWWAIVATANDYHMTIKVNDENIAKACWDDSALEKRRTQAYKDCE